MKTKNRDFKARSLLLLIFVMMLFLAATRWDMVFAEEPEELTTGAEELLDIGAEAEGEETASEEPEAVDLIDWAKELLPDVVSIVLLFLGMMISLRPQMINNGSLAKQMITYAKTMTENKDAAEGEIKALLEKYQVVKDRIESAVGVIEKYKDQIEQVLSNEEALMEALRLAFGNNTELVKKGTAEIICNLLEGVDKPEKKPEEKGNEQEVI